MNYVIQVEFQVDDLFTDDGHPVAGVIMTRKMESVTQSFMQNLQSMVLTLQSDFNSNSEIIELKAICVESFDGIEEGNIYY